MADNRIDFMHEGEKYFAEQVASKQDSVFGGQSFMIDLATIPKGSKINDVSSEFGKEIFPITPPHGFMFFIGKYPKE